MEGETLELSPPFDPDRGLRVRVGMGGRDVGNQLYTRYAVRNFANFSGKYLKSILQKTLKLP